MEVHTPGQRGHTSPNAALSNGYKGNARSRPTNGQGNWDSPKWSSSPPRSPPRTPQGPRPNTRESITSSKVYRDLSPQKVWDMSPASESRTSLPSLFRLRNGLQSLRPTYSVDFASTQHQDQQRQPKLLQSLESFLNERLAMVDKVGSTSRGYASAKMRTDAHQQVFDAFLHSFITYRSLLMRIKGEYDRSLDDALKSVFDSVHMQAEVITAQEQLDSAIRNAQQAAMEDAAETRREIQDEIQQQEAWAAEAERRLELAEEETSAIKAGIAKLQEEEVELSKANQQAHQALLSQSSFAVKPGSPSEDAQDTEQD